jgi:microsomal dipeptidase-like Zn-dependent dipeptidase
VRKDALAVHRPPRLHEEQISKIWSGNLLRVWGEVEKVAKDIQAGGR